MTGMLAVPRIAYPPGAGGPTLLELGQAFRAASDVGRCETRQGKGEPERPGVPDTRRAAPAKPLSKDLPGPASRRDSGDRQDEQPVVAVHALSRGPAGEAAAAFFKETGSRSGYVLTRLFIPAWLSHLTFGCTSSLLVPPTCGFAVRIPSIATLGARIEIPNRDCPTSKSLALKVTTASAWPLTAAAVEAE